jgi:hypothetical protein
MAQFFDDFTLAGNVNFGAGDVLISLGQMSPLLIGVRYAHGGPVWPIAVYSTTGGKFKVRHYPISLSGREHPWARLPNSQSSRTLTVRAGP